MCARSTAWPPPQRVSSAEAARPPRVRRLTEEPRQRRLQYLRQQRELAGADGDGATFQAAYVRLAAAQYQCHLCQRPLFVRAALADASRQVAVKLLELFGI